MKKVAKIFGSFIFSPYLCTRNQETTVSPMQWRDGRVVDYSSLENYRTERYRGFESLSLRSYNTAANWTPVSYGVFLFS